MAIKLMGRRAPKKPSLPAFNYIGYHFEALGLFCDTDQPMQAAFVKLDQNLDVVKTINLKIARTPYAVPGPKALEVTGLRPSDLTSSDRITEYEAAKEVSKTVGTRSAADGQKTVIFGYNILSYDERLLRYFLFRNLQDTYLTTGKDVRRLDLYPAFQYLDFIRPGIIKPGTKDDGSVSWRLSDVMIANGMISENAHDAEADTLMTKDLLVIFVRAAPSVFQQFVDLSNKKYVGSLIQKHMTGGDFLFEFSHFGAPEVTPFAPMAKVGNSGYKTVGVDLAIHPREWMHMSAEEIAENLYKGDGPFRIIKHNACPVLVDRHDRSLRMRLTEMRYRCDFDTLERRAEHIRRPDIVKKFQEVASIMEADGRQKFSGRKVARESEIYNKFVSNEDRNRCRIISREEEWDRRLQQIEKLTDPRLKDFAGRLVALHAPEELVQEEHLLALREQYAIRLNDSDDSGTVQTIAIAERELEKVEDPVLREECAEMLKNLRQEFREEIEVIDECIAEMRTFDMAKSEKKQGELDLGLFV